MSINGDVIAADDETGNKIKLRPLIVALGVIFFTWLVVMIVGSGGAVGSGISAGQSSALKAIFLPSILGLAPMYLAIFALIYYRHKKSIWVVLGGGAGILLCLLAGWQIQPAYLWLPWLPIFLLVYTVKFRPEVPKWMFAIGMIFFAVAVASTAGWLSGLEDNYAKHKDIPAFLHVLFQLGLVALASHFTQPNLAAREPERTKLLGAISCFMLLSAGVLWVLFPQMFWSVGGFFAFVAAIMISRIGLRFIMYYSRVIGFLSGIRAAEPEGIVRGSNVDRL